MLLRCGKTLSNVPPHIGWQKPPEYRAASGESHLSRESRNFNGVALLCSLRDCSIKPDEDLRPSTKRKKPIDSEVTWGRDPSSPHPPSQITLLDHKYKEAPGTWCWLYLSFILFGREIRGFAKESRYLVKKKISWEKVQRSDLHMTYLVWSIKLFFWDYWKKAERAPG